MGTVVAWNVFSESFPAATIPAPTCDRDHFQKRARNSSSAAAHANQNIVDQRDRGRGTFGRRRSTAGVNLKDKEITMTRIVFGKASTITRQARPTTTLLDGVKKQEIPCVLPKLRTYGNGPFVADQSACSQI
jgi:hypothetical protein